MQRSDGTESREALVALLVIAVATVLVYSSTFGASFQFDDIPTIVLNERLRDLRSQWPPSGSRWLGNLSFALNYRVGRLEVFGYHLVNLLIHVCNGLLVFWLTAITLRTPELRRAEAGPLVRRYLPLSAGLLFAVHPVATQAVTYIVQRFASLATLFFLLSLALYAQARLSLEADRPSRARAACLYCLSIVAAAGAMKTKEISFTLSFVAAGYELLFFRPGKRLLLLAPLAATALLVPLGLDPSLAGGAGHGVAETTEIPRSVYLLTQSRAVVTYLRLLLLPIGQNLDYDFPLSHSLGDPRVLLALAVLLAVAASAVFLLFRGRKTNRTPGVLVFFGVLWFFVTLSVESSIIPIRDVIFEHRVYLPSAGAAVALGTALLWAIERLRLPISVGLQCAVALLITAGPLGVATYARNFVWKDDLTLWSDVVAKSPQKARPHDNLGVAYREKGQLDDAVREHRIAIRLDPSMVLAHTNLGVAYEAKGQLDDAVREYNEAIRLDPSTVVAYNNLGVVYRAKGQLDDAVREWREAIRLDPSMASAHNNLGVVYRAKGQLDDALREYREAIRLDPSMASAHDNLGAAFLAKGQLDDAVREWREAIQLAPELAGAHNTLGEAYRAKGQLDDAVREYREAIRLSPSMAPAHNNLGIIYKTRGQLEDAVREYRDAIRIDPGLAEAHNNLGSAYEAKGQLDDAVHEHREAIRLAPGLVDAHYNLGIAYKAKGQLDEAVREYREAIRLHPSDPDAHYNLANTYKAKGQLDEAAREYREAIRIYPSDPDAHYNLANTYKAKRQLDEAAREYREAIRLKPGLAASAPRW